MENTPRIWTTQNSIESEKFFKAKSASMGNRRNTLKGLVHANVPKHKAYQLVQIGDQIDPEDAHEGFKWLAYRIVKHSSVGV